MRLTRTTATTAVAALFASVLSVVVLSAAPAAAAEDYYRPSSGVFLMEGHGWGHGRGMSQWGAQGAGISGVGYAKILDTYYPGTGVGTLGGRMRVLLSADTGRDVVVRPATGLTVRDLNTGGTHVLPVDSAITRWRFYVSSDGMRVQRYAGGVWTNWKTPSGTWVFTGPLQFEGADLRVYYPDGTARDVRGVLRAVRKTSTSSYTVNDLTLEDYLRGVVPSESPSWFHIEALKAQSVAARSYSAYKRAHVSTTAKYDICDTVMCQVYSGRRLITRTGSVIEMEKASTNDAIDATRGQVRTWNGRPIFAEFSSSSGGWSSASPTAPYLTAHVDPYDGIDARNKNHHWQGQITVAQLEKAFPALGSLRRMRITKRDGNGEWGGRVLEVVLEGVSSSGQATSVVTNGSGIFYAAQWPGVTGGMRGRWFRVIPTPGSTVVAKTATPFSLIKSPGPGVRTMTADIRNTGTSNWSTTGLHLTVASADGAADPLTRGDTTPGSFAGNLTRPGATSVRPGEVARFKVRIDTAGLAAGRHTQDYQVRVGSRAGFGAPVRFSVDVVLPVLTGTVVRAVQDMTVPRTGTVASAIHVKNTGNLSWKVGGPLRMQSTITAGSPSYDEPTWITTRTLTRITGNMTRPGAPTVRPGEVARFTYRLNGNGRAAGTYSEDFGFRWFGFRTMPTRLTLRYQVK